MKSNILMGPAKLFTVAHSFSVSCCYMRTKVSFLIDSYAMVRESVFFHLSKL